MTNPATSISTSTAIETLLCERVLSNANVHAEALNLCKSVTSQFLSAESTKRESVAFIKFVQDRPSLQAHLSQALIEVLKQSFYPRILNCCFIYITYLHVSRSVYMMSPIYSYGRVLSDNAQLREVYASGALLGINVTTLF